MKGVEADHRKAFYFSSIFLFMKILIIGHYPPHKGGVANHTNNLVKELRKKYEVHILTYGPIKPRKFEREFVHQVKVPQIFGLRGILFIFLAALKTIKLQKRTKFDVIHAHYVGTTSYAGILAKEKLNAPVIVTAHGSDLDFMSNLPLGRYFVKKSLSKSDLVIAVSHHLQKKAISMGATKIRVIPNSIKTIKKEDAKREYITFIGALTPYKDPQTFIKLAKRFPHEKFLVVGNGPLRTDLEKQAPKNVKFLGYKEDVGGILSKTKLLVVPSLREGFGLVIIEANSLGVPVIGRAVGGIKELIREGKNGYTFKTFEELVEKVEILLSNKKALKMGKIGKTISNQYSWERIGHLIEESYREVLGERNDNCNKHARKSRLEENQSSCEIY